MSEGNKTVVDGVEREKTSMLPINQFRAAFKERDAALAVIRDLITRLEDDYDIEDGRDGPRPNWAMTLVSEISEMCQKHGITVPEGGGSERIKEFDTATKQYARHICSLEKKQTELINVLREAQWVCPRHNGNDSCSGCGKQKHLGCEPDCPVAKITGDYGGEE